MLRCKKRKNMMSVSSAATWVVVSFISQVVGILTSPDVRLASWRVRLSRRAIRVREQTVTDNSFDVVIVGARCAGSPLAALLARRG